MSGGRTPKSPATGHSERAIVSHRGPGTVPDPEPPTTLTRVMSPNAGTQLAVSSLEIRFVMCDVCERPCRQPARCCECQDVGHPACMRLHTYEGYTFCQPCLPIAMRKLRQAQTAQQREHWRMA